MLKLVKCFRSNTVLTTKILAFINPYLEKCGDKLFLVNYNYTFVPTHAPNVELKFTTNRFDSGPLRTMPRKSRKSNGFQLNTSKSKSVQPSVGKRKRLSRRCKVMNSIDGEENELNSLKITKKKMVEEPNISSASSDELSVLYDLKEEKKNKVYEVITVASDDESNGECSKDCNDKKVPNNIDQTDDDIICLGVVSNSFNKDSIMSMDNVSRLKCDPLIPDNNYSLPVDLSNYGFASNKFTTLNYMDSVSKPSNKLMNRIRARNDSDVEEIFLSSDSESFDSLANINLNSFHTTPERDQSMSNDFKEDSEASNSFSSEFKQESNESVNLKLRVRKTKDMNNYAIIDDREEGLPNMINFSSTLSSSSSNDNGETGDSSRSSVTLFGSGSSAEESSDNSYDGTSVKNTKWKETEDSRNKLHLRNEEFTDIGKHYRSGDLKEDSNHMIFNLMSYNMLSQQLLDNHRDLYLKSDPRTLKWEFRWKLLFEEIQNENPDILCMQEVEERHLEHFYNQLTTMGYNYIYKKRTRSQVDGCAIYYKESKFDLDEYSPLEYFSRGINCLDRDNVGLVARLKPKGSPEDAIVVATTHLLYNPRRFDVRLAQIQLMLAEIDRLAYNNKKKMYYPIILTGDFNETPQSSVYSLITEGKFRYEGLSSKTLANTRDHTRMSRVLVPYWKGVTDNCQYVDVLKERKQQNEQIRRESIERNTSSDEDLVSGSETSCTEESFSSGKLTHNLKFTSVYKYVKEDGSLEASTQHDSWITVDYIFYSLVENSQTKRFEEGNLKLLSKIRLPTQSECKNQIRSLPNHSIGSDHLSLSAKFLLHLKVDTGAN